MSENIRVALSGPAGSGKSFVVRFFAEHLGFETADLGSLFRQRAAARNVSIHEYDRFVEQNPEEDRAMDLQLRQIVLSTDRDIIVSWRMAFHVAPEVFAIWLDVAPAEAARRILQDTQRKAEQRNISTAELEKLNQQRLEAVRLRLSKLYQTDITAKTNYAAVVDSTGLTPQQTVCEVAAAISRHFPQFAERYEPRLRLALQQPR